MGRPQGWTSAQIGVRAPMRSPGRPPVARREDRAAVLGGDRRGAVERGGGDRVPGCRRPVGARWFREGGGMPPISLAPLSGRYLSFAEREEIAILQRPAAAGCARSLAGSVARPSTISRELRRNAATRSGRLEYRATTAQWHAERRASAPEGRQARRQRRAARATCRTGSPARSPAPTATAGAGPGGALDRPPPRSPRRTGAGRRRGARSRSRTGCGSTSPMMSRCGSPTRRSTRRSTCRAAAR